MRDISFDKDIKFPLYRFTKKKWVNCFFNTGQLRLGTLFDYAQNEIYGDAIHDRHEGYYYWLVPEDKCTQNCVELRATLARNNLLLCLSTEYDKDLYEEFDADCCIQINSMEFFIEIDNMLQKDYTELLLRPVRYHDKSTYANYDDFAGIIKDISFSYQREVRALWEPKKEYIMDSADTPLSQLDGWDEDILFNVTNENWYKKYVKKQCKWLKPKTIFVPEAIKHCSLINK